MDRFRQFLSRLQAWFLGLDPQRRVRLIVSSALSLALTAALWGWASHDPMTVLFPQPLDPKTTTTVLENLTAQGIPYRLEPGSDRIYVPRSARDAVALRLRGTVLELTDGSGPCSLGDGKFGVTQFVEHVEWVRCMESQIEGQINAFAQVLGSDVILSIPQRSLFVEDEEDPSASVHVEMKGGSTITREEGKRMAAMVAASVPRLRTMRVEILDSELRVLHAASDADDAAMAANSLADRRRTEERAARRKIENILEPLVGPGNVFAEVNVELDVTERSIHNVELDPDKAVAMASKTREESKTGFTSGGVPGTTANIVEQKAANPAASGRGQKSSTSDEQVRLEVPRKTTQENTAPGRMVGIHAAVVVDGTWKLPAEGEAPAEGEEAASADGEPVPVYTPRGDEELVLFASLVAGALGTSVDNVTVVNRPFAKPDVTKKKPTATFLPKPEQVSTMVPWVMALIALLLTFTMVVRPVVREVTEAPTLEEQQQAAALLAEGGGAEEEEQGNPAEAMLAGLLETMSSGDRAIGRDEIGQLVVADVTHSVVTIQAWIQSEG